MTHFTKIFALSFLCFTFFLSCKKIQSDKILEHKIKAIVTENTDSVLDLESITDFDWDNVLILGPYSNPETVERNLGIDLSSIMHTGIEIRDDINQLVFLKKNAIVRMVEYPRYPAGDFIVNTNTNLLLTPKSRSKFKIETTNDKSAEGNNWIVLVQQ